VIVSNNANFVKGKDGEPILISWDDADTLFHEFGHALHGLNSNVTYPQLAGTNVPRDYVEFPSQLLERWLSTRQVLDQFALHFQTGQPMPADLVKKIEHTETFNQGFKTVEYLSSALVDMKLHLAKEPTADPRQFEKETLAELVMPREIVMRHRTAQFHHIFADVTRRATTAISGRIRSRPTPTRLSWRPRALTTRRWRSGCTTTSSAWATPWIRRKAIAPSAATTLASAR